MPTNRNLRSGSSPASPDLNGVGAKSKVEGPKARVTVDFVSIAIP
jgi:hypothetical protein